jgi:hypothetical protein
MRISGWLQAMPAKSAWRTSAGMAAEPYRGKTLEKLRGIHVLSPSAARGDNSAQLQ